MPKHIVKRVLTGFVALFVLANIIPFLMKATPGLSFSLAEYKTPEALVTAEAKYNLDKPLVEQHVIYLKGVAQGNFGESMISVGHNVSYYIKTGLPVTVRLGLIVFVLALVGGITLGAGTVLSWHRWVNDPCMSVATIGVSVPSLLIAMIILIVFGVQLHVLPFIGSNGLLNYIMSALSLTLYPITMTARLTRSSILEAMNQDYIILAHSEGTPYKKAVIKYALKNVILPVVACAGPMFTFTLMGNFVIENVFSISSIGSAFVSCITTRDYPAIMGLTIFLGFLVITFSLITGILSAIIDPRIKLD